MFAQVFFSCFVLLCTTNKEMYHERHIEVSRGEKAFRKPSSDYHFAMGLTSIYECEKSSAEFPVGSASFLAPFMLLFCCSLSEGIFSFVSKEWEQGGTGHGEVKALRVVACSYE